MMQRQGVKIKILEKLISFMKEMQEFVLLFSFWKASSIYAQSPFKTKQNKTLFM